MESDTFEITIYIKVNSREEFFIARSLIWALFRIVGSNNKDPEHVTRWYYDRYILTIQSIQFIQDESIDGFFYTRIKKTNGSYATFSCYTTEKTKEESMPGIIDPTSSTYTFKEAIPDWFIEELADSVKFVNVFSFYLYMHFKYFTRHVV